jgi:hypothetical protein
MTTATMQLNSEGYNFGASIRKYIYGKSFLIGDIFMKLHKKQKKTCAFSEKLYLKVRYVL